MYKIRPTRNTLFWENHGCHKKIRSCSLRISKLQRVFTFSKVVAFHYMYLMGVEYVLYSPVEMRTFQLAVLVYQRVKCVLKNHAEGFQHGHHKKGDGH